MKKILSILFVIPNLLWGMTFESDCMEEALPHVETSKTWVLIDVDNTLIESSMHLGSAQWRTHIRNKALKMGYTIDEAGLVLDKFWIFVQHFIPVHLVDPAALSLIQDLQNSQTTVLALTAREPIEREHTQRQLSSVNLNLENSTFPETLNFSAAYPSLYDKGVIYCGDNTKSQALVAFFQEVGVIPEKVIFIDDKSEQVKELEKTLEQMGITFVGIRFSRADERVKAFNPKVADLQFSYLPHLLSDEEAEQLLNSTH